MATPTWDETDPLEMTSPTATTPTWEDTEELPKVDQMESGIRGAAQGASMGFADEITGAVESILTDKTYREARDESRKAYDAAKLANPKTYMAGEFGGAAATALVPGLGELTIPKMAAQGALYGLGSSEADLTKGDIGGAAKDVAIGGAVGTVAGGVGKAVSKAVPWMAKKALGALGPSAEAIEGRLGQTAAKGLEKGPVAESEVLEGIANDLKQKFIQGSAKAQSHLSPESYTTLEELHPIFQNLKNDLLTQGNLVGEEQTAASQVLDDWFKNLQKMVVAPQNVTRQAELYVAPLRGYNADVNTTASLLTHPEYQTWLQRLKGVMGNSPHDIKPAIGKWLDTELGQEVTEPSARIFVRTMDPEALAAKMGAGLKAQGERFGMPQQAVLMIEEGSAAANGMKYEIQLNNRQSMQKWFPELKKYGIEYPTMVPGENTIVLADQGNALTPNIEAFIADVKRNGVLSNVKQANAKISFIGEERYPDLLHKATQLEQGGQNIIPEPALGDFIRALDKNVPNWNAPHANIIDSVQKQLRGALDQALKTNNPEYAKAMEPVSKFINLRNQLKKAFNLSDTFEATDTTNSKMGTVLKESKTHAQELLKELEDMYGHPFSENLKNFQLGQEFESGAPVKGLGLLGKASRLIGVDGGAVAKRIIDTYLSAKGSVEDTAASKALQKYGPLLADAAKRGGNALAATHFVLATSNPEYQELVDQNQE